jgi:hypothetical protein
MAFVVLGGLFEPGTAVSLYELEDEAVLRVESHPLVGRRLADKAGTVGFDGLDEGTRYMARGTDVYGNPIEERCRGLSELEGTEVAQPPIRPQSQPVGTQEQVVPPTAPVAAPAAILHTGVPAGVPLGVTTS